MGGGKDWESVAKPKPNAPSTKHAPSSANSEALEALRAATSTAEAEENKRYELKDSVDARLTTWKGGKEPNIRDSQLYSVTGAIMAESGDA